MKSEVSMVFKHQVVKDLAFVLKAPLIYQDLDITKHWLPDTQDKLIQLDKKPAPLFQMVDSCKSHFLGSYFETLFSFALNHFSSFKVIFEHTQLISPERTLGEIDALVTDANGQAHQLEVAIKFYLESSDEVGHWIGPNKNDSFVKKYQRAKTHQLTILDLPEAKPLLEQYSLSLPIERHLLMFGALFQQLADLDSLALFENDKTHCEKDKNKEINPFAKTGFWVRINNLNWLHKGFLSSQEMLKPFWISTPIDQEVAANKWRNFHTWQADLESKFKEDERPRLFLLTWRKEEGSSKNLRLFVVPEYW